MVRPITPEDFLRWGFQERGEQLPDEIKDALPKEPEFDFSQKVNEVGVLDTAQILDDPNISDAIKLVLKWWVTRCLKLEDKISEQTKKNFIVSLGMDKV